MLFTNWVPVTINSEFYSDFSSLAVPVEMSWGVMEGAVSIWQVPRGWALKCPTLQVPHTLDPSSLSSLSLTSYSHSCFQSLKARYPFRLIIIHSSGGLTPPAERDVKYCSAALVCVCYYLGHLSSGLRFGINIEVNRSSSCKGKMLEFGYHWFILCFISDHHSKHCIKCRQFTPKYVCPERVSERMGHMLCNPLKT